MPDYEVLTGERRGGRRIFGVHLSPSSRDRVTFRLVFGLIVIVLGALWTLDNLNIVESEPILRWWPSLLVLLGACRLLGLGCRPQPVSGTVFAVVGLVLLGNELDVLNIRLWHLWPILLIVLGTSLVIRSLRGPLATGADPGSRQDALNTFTMMGGLHVKNDSQAFCGGDVSAVMGGVEVDLRGARAAAPEIILDAFAWWGGIDLFVPKDWKVVSEVLPLMGGYEDQTSPVEGEAKTTLIIRGAVIMGGLEVKN